MEKIDYMMIAFKHFETELKANHIVEDLNGFKKEAARLADEVRHKRR